MGGERRKDIVLYRSHSVSSGGEFWQQTMLSLWEVSRAVIGTLDFLHQELLRALGQKKAWAELCVRQDRSVRDRGWRQEDQAVRRLPQGSPREARTLRAGPTGTRGEEWIPEGFLSRWS